MRCAIVSPDRLKYLNEFCDELEEKLAEYKDSDRTERDKDKVIGWLNTVATIGTAINHVVLAYETMFNNACDETKDYLDFRPDIKAFLEGKEKAVMPGVSFEQAIDEAGAFYEAAKDGINAAYYGMMHPVYQQDLDKALASVVKLRDYACVALQRAYGVDVEKADSSSELNGANATDGDSTTVDDAHNRELDNWKL
jgi:hypothetical protein